MHVGIIGGGIVGLCTAYSLLKEGCQVTIFEKEKIGEGCSYGNAGMIVPSHIVPFSSPGMISKGIRWMFQSKSPFYVRPALSLELISWFYLFYKHATSDHVQYAAPFLNNLSLLSREEYVKLSEELGGGEFGFKEKGLFMLFQKKETEKDEGEMVKLANDHGVEARMMGGEEINHMEPAVDKRVRGGIFFPGDAHLTPHKLMEKLFQSCIGKGLILKDQTQVLGFTKKGNNITGLQTALGLEVLDAVVVAGGSWSGQLLKTLGINLPLLGGKGYSFTMNHHYNIQIPSILLEERVAVTPMGATLRVAGTLEIAGLNKKVNIKKVQGMAEALPRYYPEMKQAGVERGVWSGFRPCSPDGLPYLGKLNRHKNVIVATGHGMMGLSLGPGTGKIVASIIKGEDPLIPMEGYSPNRFQ